MTRWLGTGLNSSMVTAYLVLLSSLQAAGHGYRVTEIPVGIKLNNQGQVVGTSNSIGFLWEPNAPSTARLPPLSQHAHSTARDISDFGLIVGVSNTNGGTVDDGLAVYWERGSGGFEARDWNILLPPEVSASGVVLSWPYDISSDGQYVVFASRNPAFTRQALIARVLYKDGRPSRLESVDLLDEASLYTVTHDGQGTIRCIGFFESVGVVYWKLVPGSTPTVTVFANANGLSPVSVNNSGEIVGYQHASAGGNRALLWGEDDLSMPTDLGTLGGSMARANWINNSGQIVGTSRTALGTDHAVIWQHDAILDLNSLVLIAGGMLLTEAISINDVGQILVRGTANDASIAVLLTPELECMDAAVVYGPAVTEGMFVIRYSGVPGGAYRIQFADAAQRNRMVLVLRSRSRPRRTRWTMDEHENEEEIPAESSEFHS